MSSNPTTWLVALLTLASFSWAWKQNFAYRFVENLFVGLGAGYGLVIAWDNINSAGVVPLTKGNYWRIIPMVLGFVLISSVITAWQRNRQLPMAIIIGTGTGVAIRSCLQSQFLAQISASWLMPNTFNNIVIIVGSVTSLAFFFFTIATREDTIGGQVQQVLRTIGAVVLMMCFGASFATAVQARLSTFVARLQFLFTEWITVFNK